MPEERDIERLGRELLKLREEPRVLDEWGETVEIPPPVEPEVHVPVSRTGEEEERAGEGEESIEGLLSRFGDEQPEEEKSEGDAFEALGFEPLEEDLEGEMPQADLPEELPEGLFDLGEEETPAGEDLGVLEELPELGEEGPEEAAPSVEGLEGVSPEDAEATPPVEDLAGGEPAGEGREEFVLPDFHELEEEPGEALPEPDEDLGLSLDFTEDEGEVTPGSPEEEAPPVPSPEDLALEEEALLAEEFPEDIEVEEFSLRDLGEEFGVVEEEPGLVAEEESLNPAIAITPEAVEELPETGFGLTEQEFRRLQEHLFSLPRNLKMEIESLVAEAKVGGEDLERLVRMLVEGESPRALAAFVGRLTGKRIRIPARYERGTGAEFEEAKGGLWYLVRYRLLPVVRAVLVGTLILAGLTAVVFQFVYRPIRAHLLYTEGYRQIFQEEYDASLLRFEQGLRLWRMKGWFFRYARAYTEMRQYPLAEEKYEQLLAYYPLDKEATLEYAEFESRVLANYEKADLPLERYLRLENLKDLDVLLARGDNFLRWADEGGAEDFDRFEEARKMYARAMEYHGSRAPIVQRMLMYFVHQEEKAAELGRTDVDNLSHVEQLVEYILERPKLVVDAGELARAGGYLIDRNRIDRVRDVLFRAREIQDPHPEVHYQLARYFRIVERPADEAKALQAARLLLEDLPMRTRRQTAQLVDTYRRQGDLFYGQGELLSAEDAYRDAIRLYEQALSSRLLRRSARFGSIYASLADIYYYHSAEEETALTLYETAESHGYVTPENAYKKGRLLYRKGLYDRALTEFAKSEEAFRNNRVVLFALANALYFKASYTAAEGYYRRLLDMLEREKAALPALRVDENPDHRALVEGIIRVENNLGVTLFKRSGGREGHPAYPEALTFLTDAQELFVNLYRDPETMERAGAVNLAYLNMDAILHPTVPFAQLPLAIYRSLPVDVKARGLSGP
ncbi:hypothetical protein Spith_0161 [Spirochaeta thermophila DSM 6578]|uniref:Uncharacterized protein n=1 Tax=Winmispira thermophila (strain ATCC 700085 / DSM 6578 / Z-1203) TaxID=869211 RepID=G0GC84_WINT7|nr:hypothetical protein [Spirochaeta thermophila]AEJ60448.1 hypothetical protein Spith_0161 [Spirochaeta thermophila DSM 6578]